MKKTFSKRSLMLFCAVSLVIGVIGSAVAAPTITYLLGMSADKQIQVVEGTITIPLDTAAPAQVSTTDTITLTATATGTYAAQAEGKTVHFYIDNTEVGTKVITAGQASLILPAGTLATGLHTFKAGP